MTQSGSKVRIMPVLLAGEPKERDVGQNRPAFANEVTVATSLPASTTVMEQSAWARRASALCESPAGSTERTESR